MKWGHFSRPFESFEELEQALSTLFFKLTIVILLILEFLFFAKYPWILHLFFLTGITIALLGLRSADKHRKRFFGFLVVVLYSLSSISKFMIVDLTHATPMVNFYEVTITAFLILLFGIKRVFWVPFFTLSLNYIRYYLLDVIEWGTHWVELFNNHFSYFLEVNLIVAFMLALTTVIIYQIIYSGKTLRDKNEQLKEFALTIEEGNKEIIRIKEAHLQLSIRNSHELRNHSARIKSVTEMMENMQNNTDLNDATKYEFFYLTVSTSLNEMKQTLKEITQEQAKIEG